MNFESALSTIREFGGKMKRISYPEIDYIIDMNKNILMSYDEYADLTDTEKLDEAQIWGKDIMANDWEVDISGCWKD